MPSLHRNKVKKSLLRFQEQRCMEPGRGRAEASFSSAVIRARKRQFVDRSI